MMKTLFLALAACLALAAGCGQHSAESPFVPVAAPLTIQTEFKELSAAVTFDGGHLNGEGKHLIGSALVRHLANTASPNPAK